MLDDKEDSDLINLFVNEKNKKAMEVLVRRYYNSMFKRFLRSVKNKDDAHDLSQKFWLKIIKGMENYKEGGKFINYLHTTASNVIKDSWRSNAKYSNNIEDDFASFQAPDDIQNQHESSELVNYLTKELIPALPIELRVTYLLKHESEYWDDAHPLRWHHMAELNKVDAVTAGKQFELARNKLILNEYNVNKKRTITEEEKLYFLVWTQSKRQNKHSKLTEKELAKLLNIPVNTFKTRYRRALQKLSEGLEKWQQS